MAAWRKKPLVVEAVQWFPGADVAGVHEERAREALPSAPQNPRHYVVTATGRRDYLSPGDWVITEPDGVHQYVCKPDVFAATYEPA